MPVAGARPRPPAPARLLHLALTDWLQVTRLALLSSPSGQLRSEEASGVVGLRLACAAVLVGGAGVGVVVRPPSPLDREIELPRRAVLPSSLDELGVAPPPRLAGLAEGEQKRGENEG